MRWPAAGSVFNQMFRTLAEDIGCGQYRHEDMADGRGWLEEIHRGADIWQDGEISETLLAIGSSRSIWRHR